MTKVMEATNKDYEGMALIYGFDTVEEFKAEMELTVTMDETGKKNYRVGKRPEEKREEEIKEDSAEKIDNLFVEYFNNDYCGSMPIDWYIDRLNTLRNKLKTIKKENKGDSYLVWSIEEKMKKINTRKIYATSKGKSGYQTISFEERLKPTYKF